MDKIGSLNKNFVWLFAVAALGLSIASGFVTSGMGGTIASAVYFGIFAVSGFLAMALTQAGTGMGVVAFLVASLSSAAGYYFVIASATQEATSALGANAEATGVAGAFIGGFFAVIILIGTLVAGISGVVAGGRFRKKALAAA
ncbi:MAG: hypothetical protein AAGE52_15535 [Myxococcota bacterium]